jgi:DNA-directed RNA polymerase beta' subunit
MTDIAIPTKNAKFITFTPLTKEQIQNFGIKIYLPYSRNTPDTQGTPADERLGDNKKCKSCSMNYNDCPGHFGYIDLAMPVFNPIYMSYIVVVLKCVCLECSELLCPDYANDLKSDSGTRLAAYKERSDKVKNCWSCGAKRTKIMMKPKDKIIYSDDEELTPEMVLKIFESISNDSLRKIGLNSSLDFSYFSQDMISLPPRFTHPCQVRPEAFIFSSLPVIPIQARPPIKQGDEKKEDELTEQYNTIIKINISIAIKLGKFDLVDKSYLEKKRGRSEKSVKELYDSLKMNIYKIIDNKMAKGAGKMNDRKLNSLSERVSGKQPHTPPNTEYGAGATLACIPRCLCERQSF